MNPASLTRDFHSSTYNSLLSVEKANDAARADSGLDQFLAEASRLFRSHRMEGRFGVGLLHNHNTVDRGEWMVESRQVRNGREALVTQPVTIEPNTEGLCPVVWQIRDGEFSPLEFSSDPLARRLLDGEVPETFLEQFKALSAKLSAGQFLGLAVVERDFYGTGRTGQVPIEFTNDEERSNVVLMCDASELSKQTIETAWSFGSEAGLACNSNCRRQCYWTDDGKHADIHQQHHTSSGD
jgi:hypothetical protein